MFCCSDKEYSDDQACLPGSTVRRFLSRDIHNVSSIYCVDQLICSSCTAGNHTLADASCTALVRNQLAMSELF